MKKAEKDEVLKILHECITHPELSNKMNAALKKVLQVMMEDL